VYKQMLINAKLQIGNIEVKKTGLIGRSLLSRRTSAVRPDDGLIKKGRNVLSIF